MNHVFLIDDDTELVGMFAEYLEQEGFRVCCAYDGESGTREALSGRYAIAVLDVMMPRLDGIDTLRRIRAQSQVPVLILTGRGDDADRILGLELLTIGELTMLPEQRRATWDGAPVELTSTEFNLLQVLARNAGYSTDVTMRMFEQGELREDQLEVNIGFRSKKLPKPVKAETEAV
jgi:two-component system OmpR family response regulator